MPALGVRGANPIWSEVDLSGHLFDDNFWLYVLENDIPYMPAPVYHFPDLTVPWSNPIRFLGNGTLPVDIFFIPGFVYRLEFRQNNGITPPDQSDPLIYLVENYVAGSGGSTPIDTITIATSNQITNPQFALIDFDSPLSLSGVTNQVLQIGPGWYLNLTGTGNVIASQERFNDSVPNPTNAPYALRLQVNGWDEGGVVLTQKFEQNGMLWANQIVSSSLTTRIGSTSPLSGPITGQLFDSNNVQLVEVLNIPNIDATFNEYTGHGHLLASTNPQDPPAAYIEYRLSLPNNCDIYVTSLQLVVQDTQVEPLYEQDSINRQIDHTYNTAYPIVPVGTIIDFGGFVTPDHYLLCDGSAVSRLTYNLLFQAMTTTETVALNSSATITVADGTIYRIGMNIEGTGIPAATTITNIVGNVITMSLAATVTASSLLRFFAAGDGDGSTTFNLYNLQDYVVAGLGGTTILSAANNGLGAVAGSPTHTLDPTELPPHTHSITTNGAVGPSVAHLTLGPVSATADTFHTGNGPGASTPFNIVQPTIFMKKCIRFE